MSIKDFFNFIMQYRWMMQTRVGLSLYDLKGLGVILESVSVGVGVRPMVGCRG